MQLIQDLQEIGYSFTINNESIKYHFKGSGEPNITKAAVLFAELKKEKQAVLEYLQRAGESQNNTKAESHNSETKFTSRVKKLDSAIIAIQLVAGITDQALSLGWTAEQLQEFTKTLSIFIPCRIGIISLQSIEVQLLWADGKLRGCLHQYNHLVDQTWLKRKGI